MFARATKGDVTPAEEKTLLIPGTSSVEHLRQNVAGAGLQLPDDAIKELDDITG
jgi:aryl-alcohol dehydrogenase-like predicted oxidoreductase